MVDEIETTPMKIELHEHEDGTLMIRNAVEALRCVRLNDSGLLHREDGPTMIEQEGTMHWCVNGEQHREHDKPAVHCDDGELKWFESGKCRRRRRRGIASRPSSVNTIQSAPGERISVELVNDDNCIANDHQ